MRRPSGGTRSYQQPRPLEALRAAGFLQLRNEVGQRLAVPGSCRVVLAQVRQRLELEPGRLLGTRFSNGTPDGGFAGARVAATACDCSLEQQKRLGRIPEALAASREHSEPHVVFIPLANAVVALARRARARIRPAAEQARRRASMRQENSSTSVRISSAIGRGSVGLS